MLKTQRFKLRVLALNGWTLFIMTLLNIRRPVISIPMHVTNVNAHLTNGTHKLIPTVKFSKLFNLLTKSSLYSQESIYESSSSLTLSYVNKTLSLSLLKSSQTFLPIFESNCNSFSNVSNNCSKKQLKIFDNEINLKKNFSLLKMQQNGLSNLTIDIKNHSFLTENNNKGKQNKIPETFWFKINTNNTKIIIKKIKFRSKKLMYKKRKRKKYSKIIINDLNLINIDNTTSKPILNETYNKNFKKNIIYHQNYESLSMVNNDTLLNNNIHSVISDKLAKVNFLTKNFSNGSSATFQTEIQLDTRSVPHLEYILKNDIYNLTKNMQNNFWKQNTTYSNQLKKFINNKKHKRLNSNLGRNVRSANLSTSGSTKKIQLFIKNRFIQLMPDGIVNGTQDEMSDFTILQRTTVEIGQIKFQGVATCLYLCMDKCGNVFGSKNFTDDCIFNESMEEHHYNTYSSTYNSNSRHILYLALNRFGEPRKLQIPPSRSLGKLATYTKSLTENVSDDRAQKLIAKLFGKNRVKHGVHHLCDAGKPLVNLTKEMLKTPPECKEVNGSTASTLPIPVSTYSYNKRRKISGENHNKRYDNSAIINENFKNTVVNSNFSRNITNTRKINTANRNENKKHCVRENTFKKRKRKQQLNEQINIRCNKGPQNSMKKNVSNQEKRLKHQQQLISENSNQSKLKLT